MEKKKGAETRFFKGDVLCGPQSDMMMMMCMICMDDVHDLHGWCA